MTTLTATARKNETRMVGRFMVRRYQIIGTDIFVHCAYEPWAGHSEMCHEGNDEFGAIKSRPLPSEIDALPVNAVRFAACAKFRADNEAAACVAIRQAFPDAAMGIERRGDVEMSARDIA